MNERASARVIEQHDTAALLKGGGGAGELRMEGKVPVDQAPFTAEAKQLLWSKESELHRKATCLHVSSREPLQ